jgi:hypothetical protein
MAVKKKAAVKVVKAVAKAATKAAKKVATEEKRPRGRPRIHEIEEKVVVEKELSKKAKDIISDLRLLDELNEGKEQLLHDLVDELGGKMSFDQGGGWGPWTIMLPREGSGRKAFWRPKPGL